MAQRSQPVWSPFSDLGYLQHQLDRLTQDAFGMRSQASVATLPVDVFDKGDELVVQAFVPGLRADHVDVQVDNGVLTISGAYPQLYDQEEMRDYTWHARELRGGRFGRSVAFPVKVDVEHAQASIADGILTLSFPKAAEAKPRRIQISEQAGASQSERVIETTGGSTR